MLCHNVWFFIPLKFLLIFLKEYKADKNEHQSRQSYSWYLRYTLQRCYEWKDGTATLLNSMKKKLIHFFTKLYVNRQENYRWTIYIRWEKSSNFGLDSICLDQKQKSLPKATRGHNYRWWKMVSLCQHKAVQRMAQHQKTSNIAVMIENPFSFNMYLVEKTSSIMNPCQTIRQWMLNSTFIIAIQSAIWDSSAM